MQGLELKNSRKQDGGFKVNTYFDPEIGIYTGGITSRVKAIYLPITVYRTINVLLEALDTVKDGGSFELMREIMYSRKFDDYLADMFKGKGKHEDHSVKILKELNAAVNEMLGERDKSKIKDRKISWSDTSKMKEETLVLTSGIKIVQFYGNAWNISKK